MSNVPDYSSFIGIKKATTSQTANLNAGPLKGRAVNPYASYSILAKAVAFPPNSLISNKFTSSSGSGSAPVLLPSYTVTASTLSIDESGLPIVFTITTENVADGTVLFWENIQSATSADFAEGINSGNVTITGGSGTVSLTILQDETTEGTEYIALRLRSSALGEILATSLTVTISDTSLAPTWTITNSSAFLTTSLADLDTSADGSKVLATKGYNPGQGLTSGPIYVNSSSGAGAWTAAGGNDFWKAGCVNRAGIIGYAGRHANKVVKSTDGGGSWSTLTGSAATVWNCLQCSDNGNVVYGATGFGTTTDRGYVRVSRDGGTTWTDYLTATPGLGVWTGIACSSGGEYAIACPAFPSATQLYRTSDSGVNWSAVGTAGTYNAVAMSASGSIAYAVPNSGTTAYKSSDYGATWSSITLPATFNDIDCSGDGTFVVGVSGTKFYASTNGGSTWTEVYTAPSSTFFRIAASNTGRIVYFMTYNGPVYKAVYA